eukprot:GHVS01021191.1.p1 GENE.GHVS01021191.1~~GHVS01021191.1.p1  ORF type:complete len:182 (+),score=29.60 GHVS01021191.1:718-1263(+)
MIACIPTGSSWPCARRSACCGSLSGLTDCQGQRCCRRVGSRCSASSECCPGTHCPSSRYRCVAGSGRTTTTTTATTTAEVDPPTTEEPTSEPLGGGDEECQAVLMQTIRQNSHLIKLTAELAQTVNQCMNRCSAQRQTQEGFLGNNDGQRKERDALSPFISIEEGREEDTISVALVTPNAS